MIDVLRDVVLVGNAAALITHIHLSRRATIRPSRPRVRKGLPAGRNGRP